MRYTINSKGIQKSEHGEFATWAEVKAEWDRRCKAADEKQSAAKQLQQQRAANGVTVTPNPPARRNTWNDQPPEDE